MKIEADSNDNPNPLGEMGLGKMGLGEMGGHRCHKELGVIR